jgi:ATP-binding cassette, subfamily B, bacterial
MSPLKFGIKRLKKFRIKLISAIVWSILFAVIPMQVPVITGTLVDGIDNSDIDKQQVRGITGTLVDGIDNSEDDKPVLFYGIIQVGNTPYRVIAFTLVSLIIVAIAYGFTSYMSISSRSIISRNFAFEIQNVLIRKLEFLSLDIHTKYGSGDLLNRTLIDTNNVRPFVEATIIKSITNVVRISYPLLMLFVIDSFLAFVVSLILPAQFLIIRNLQSRIGEASRQLRKDKARLTMLQKENLDGLETIQTSSAETYTIQKISNQIQRVEEAQVTIQRYYGMMMGFAWGLTALGVALGWSFGGLKVLSGDITLGQLIIFSGFVLFVYTPVRKLTQTVKEHHRGLVAMRHIQEILETSSSIVESKNSTGLKITQGRIIFRNVSLSFKKRKKNRTILNNICINIKPNSITAIVGRSGAGKSSILKLITRLYDPLEGEVLIDGKDIKTVSIQSLRSQIAVVPQIPIIFTGTIMENIRLANPDASDFEVEQACLNADALKFIKKFKKGLDTVIGQRGDNLSEGEAQRIAIARALLKKAKILLLDEPSSAIDPEATASIMNSLHHLKKDMTIVLINHNREAIDKADNIITIDNKRVAEVVEDKITKEIKLEGGSCIAYSRDSLNYILVPNDSMKLKNTVVSNTNENPTTLNYNFVPNSNKEDRNGVVSNTNQNPITEFSSIKKEQASNLLEYKFVGRSARQRRINVVLIGERSNPRLKVLVIAGQHGDEKYGRIATERLIDYLLNTRVKEFPQICIAIFPNVNPDGSHKNIRRTTSGIDMNRDHLRLSSQEICTVHSFIRSWNPNIIIDVHNYPPERRYLRERNYVFCQDVLIDIPSNLAVHKRMEQDKLENLIGDIGFDLKPFNCSCDRYVIINPEGKVRHSTHDIVDARNFLSLRYNTLTILLEAIEPLQGNKKDEIENTILAQYLALLSILKWARKNTLYLIENSNGLPHKKGDKIAISCKYVTSDQPFKMKFRNTLTNKIEEVTLPNYDSTIRATRHIKLPSAYAVPKANTQVVKVLGTHGFVAGLTSDSKLCVTERYFIQSLMSPKGKDKPASEINVIVTCKKQNLDNYEIFSINQQGGHALALLLEPQSEYGLHRYSNLNLNLTSKSDYPILRVM